MTPRTPPGPADIAAAEMARQDRAALAHYADTLRAVLGDPEWAARYAESEIAAKAQMAEMVADFQRRKGAKNGQR